jgi:hypothetical protein
MVTYFSIRKDAYEEMKQEHREELNTKSIEELVKDFFAYLDYTEESDSGRVFHPVEISCCRVLMSEPLGMLLQELRKRVNHEQ